jgi:hypothetical protein
MNIKYLNGKKNAKSIFKIIINISLFDKINKIDYDSDIKTYKIVNAENIAEIFKFFNSSFKEKMKK